MEEENWFEYKHICNTQQPEAIPEKKLQFSPIFVKILHFPRDIFQRIEKRRIYWYPLKISSYNQKLSNVVKILARISTNEVDSSLY